MRNSLWLDHINNVPALAYLLTFSTYGTHLPGSEKGWVDAKHCLFGSPTQPYNLEKQTYWTSHLREAPWVLDTEARLLTLRTILAVCTHRQWIARAIHCRTTHVHAIVSGDTKPERMLSDLKAYATRAFRSTATIPCRQRYWTDHGSTRYLWNESSLNAAIDYVINGQGSKMAYYQR